MIILTIILKKEQKMIILEKIDDVRKEIKKAKEKGKRIALVPTMGCLHKGHLSLIRKAKEISDYVVISIFVNPKQFGPNEDFDKYPRTFEKDVELSKNEGVNLIFHPSVDEMYGESFSTFVEVEGRISEILCGARRMGHFKGVATVVSKLFNIVTPDVAIFGQKDAQQALIIKKMVKELNFPIKIVISQTVREDDGVAMSSRNTYLSKKERRDAHLIYDGLKAALNLHDKGVTSSLELKKVVEDKILSSPLFKIDYVEIIDLESYESVEKVEKPSLLAVAAFLGNTRLIDNVILGGKNGD
jgi:pantoate--beta-alanine ligase